MKQLTNNARIDSMVSTMEILTPKYIVDYLDKYIIGQTEAKRAMAVALRNRYRRLKLSQEDRDNISPKNLMMIGPTGVGKTEIARKIARLIGAPFIKVEATKYTEVGYVGRDVESMIRDLVANSISIVKKELANQNKGNTLLAANYRIFQIMTNKKNELGLNNYDDAQLKRSINNGELDNYEIEIDYTPAPKNPLGDIMSGVNVIGIDNGGFPPDLSKLFGGGKKSKKRVRVSHAREIFQLEEMEKIADEDQINEDAIWRAEQLGIVFIDEFDKIASAQDMRGSGSISREGVQRDILPIVEGSQVHTRYGIIDTENILFIAAGAFYVSKPSDLIPELQGRFPIRVELKDLSVEDFVKILFETDNSLVDQYKKLINTEGIEIKVEKDAVQTIAEIAFEMNSESENIGARRLYTVMEKLFEDLMFNAPQMKEKSVLINKNYIRERIKDMTGNKEAYKYIL